MRVLPFLSIAASALSSGKRLRRSRNVDYRTDVESVTLVADPTRPKGAMPYQIDGDHLGPVERLEFRHEARALRLVLP
jgi:hypothetical protein